MIRYTNIHGAASMWVSDQGSHFSQLHSCLTPMQQAKHVQSFPPFWKELLLPKAQDQIKSIGSSFRRISAKRHKCAGKVEQLGYHLKTFFRKFKYNQKSGKRLNILELQYVLSKVQLSFHTRPILAHNGQLFCSQDLFVAGLQATPYLGTTGLTRRGLDTEDDVHLFKTAMKDINDLTKETLGCILDNLLPFLFSQNEFKERCGAKFGPVTEDLQQGALVFDPRVYLKTGDVVGSLHRVESISQSGHYAILSRTRRTLLWDKTWLRDWHLNEGKLAEHEIAERYRDTWVVTSRPCEDLFLVCNDDNWTGPNTTQFAGGLKMFSFGECLEKINRDRHFPLRLPPAPCVAVSELEDEWDPENIPLACTHGQQEMEENNEDNLADNVDEEIQESDEEESIEGTNMHEASILPSYMCEECHLRFPDLDEMKQHVYDNHLKPDEVNRSRYGRRINQAPNYNPSSRPRRR
jgi:hypothetical protein